MGDLTTNFSKSEFTRSVSWDSLSTRSQGMVKSMAQLLQKIRDKAGKTISISSAVRSMSDYDRLKAQGLNPSPTSDHFYGQPVVLEPSSSISAVRSAYAKYGSPYKLSVGACDITCPGMDIFEFFNLVLKMRYDGEIKTGQLLLEKHNTWWVHIANDPAPWLSAAELSLRGPTSTGGVGWSDNGGVSFSWIPSGKFYGQYSKAASIATNLAVRLDVPQENWEYFMYGMGAIGALALLAGGLFIKSRLSGRRGSRKAVPKYLPRNAKSHKRKWRR